MLPLTRMIQTRTRSNTCTWWAYRAGEEHAGEPAEYQAVNWDDGWVIVPLGQARSRSRAYQMMVDMIVAAVGHWGKSR